MTSVDLILYSDNFFETSSVKIFNFANNEFSGLSGIGAIVES